MIKRAVSLVATGVLFASTAVPAYAFDPERMLKDLTGVRDIKDLGMPMLLGVVVLGIVFFWSVSRFGKWRQKRMINHYHDELDEFSNRLRSGRRG